MVRILSDMVELSEEIRLIAPPWTTKQRRENVRVKHVIRHETWECKKGDCALDGDPREQLIK